MKVLVLGATGMLGNAVYRVLSNCSDMQTYGSIRHDAARQLFPTDLRAGLKVVKDLENQIELEQLFGSISPDIVINCTSQANLNPNDPMRSISLFSVLPHRLSYLCAREGTRLIQISSDGVFSGRRGQYTEDDIPDADDLYGIAKLLGEVTGQHAITLRTSIIGHQLQGAGGLLEWFLAQKNECKCYRQAIFSGFPTVVLAEIISKIIIPRPGLNGIYHVATKPISKYELLELVAKRYGKIITLIPDDKVAIDRSLRTNKFNAATGYTAPDWPSLIDEMYSDKFGLGKA